MDTIGTIRLKKNDTVNSQQVAVAPLASELEFGELAINYNPLDPCLFFKDKAGNIVKIVDENVIVDTLKDILGGAATDLDTLKELLAEFASSDLATVQAQMLSRLDQLDIAVANKADRSALNAHINNSSNPHGVTKTQVGLSNVDNTSDVNKPVSTAQATAIADAKQAGTDAQTNLTTHIGSNTNPHSVTKAQVGLGNVVDKEQLGKTETAADSSKLGGATPDNVRNFCVGYGANTDGKYDANSIASTGGCLSQYVGARWLNGPTNMGYGTIYQIPTPYKEPGGIKSLTPQLAFDIIHDTDTPTRGFWFRTSNDRGFKDDWKEVYHSGNSNHANANWTGRIINSGSVDDNTFGCFQQNRNGYYSRFNQLGGTTFITNVKVEGDAIQGQLKIGAGLLQFGNDNIWHAGNSNKSDVTWQAKTLVGAYGADSGLRIGSTLDYFTINKVDTKTVFTHREDDTDANNGHGYFDFFVDSPSSINKPRFLLRDRNNEYIRVTGSRRVGIYNSNPIEMLDVSGNIKATNIYTTNLINGSADFHLSGLYGSITTRHKGSSYWNAGLVVYGDVTTPEHINKFGVFTHYKGALRIGTQWRDVAGLTYAHTPIEISPSIGQHSLFIKTNGYIGFGTDNALAPVHAKGIIRTDAFYITDSGTADTNQWLLQARGSTIAGLYKYSNGNLILSTNNANRLVVTKDGNVGIGDNQNITSKLQVDGNGLFSGNVTAKGDVVAKASGAVVFATEAQGGAGNLFELGDVDIPLNPTDNFVLMYNAKEQKWVANKVPNHNHDGQVYASDKNLKEGIVDMRDAMVMINNMKPKTYHWNKAAEDLNLGHGKAYGLIAQEVELLYPEIVKSIAGTPYKGIDYVKIIPILISAIQEQNEVIAKTNAMLKTYERRQNKAVSDNFNDNKRITELEKQIEELKQMVYNGFNK